MKITAESKFDKGQQVFVLYGNQIVKAKISDAKIGIFCGFYSIQYDCWGEYRSSNRISIGNHQYYESEVYATENEAKIEWRKKKDQLIKGSLDDIKKSVCAVYRGWSLSETSNPALKTFISACGKFNSELIAILKEIKNQPKINQ